MTWQSQGNASLLIGKYYFITCTCMLVGTKESSRFLQKTSIPLASTEEVFGFNPPMPHHSGISSCFLYKILAFGIHSSPWDFSTKPPWGGYRNRLEPSLNYWVIMVAVLHEFGLIVPGSYITYLSAQILHLHAWVVCLETVIRVSPKSWDTQGDKLLWQASAANHSGCIICF